MDLNSMFPKGKTFKTEAAARKRLAAFEARLDDPNLHHYHSVIIPKGDRYQVIIILGHECRIPILWFVDSGFCATNV
jgi:hypothetical protein